MNDLGCLEVCCDIKSVSKADFTKLNLIELFRFACHGLASTEDSRYVPDDPTMNDENHNTKEISKGDIPEVPSFLPSACELVIP